MTAPPRATYRLQLRQGVTLGEARRLVPYLDRLGISHLYLAPVLRARTGSTHGYDVVDPTGLDAAVGTRRSFTALAAALRRRRMSVLLDIVPNHLAASAENRWWWDVLEHGRRSRFAAWFDIRWGEDPAAQGRLVLPVLGAPLAQLVDRGELTLAVEAGRPVIRYHQHRFPVAPGTWEEPHQEPEVRLRVLQAQAYRLEPWQTAAWRVNYRRFFDINDLVGVRAELPEVFDATHALVLQLARRGHIDGLRIDHIDGLADPAGYLRRLQRALAAAPGTGRWRRFWVVVEKILAADEELPSRWEVDGTTGYEFLAAVAGLFVDARGFARLRDLAARTAGGPRSWPGFAFAMKRKVIEELFAGERHQLTAELERLARRLSGGNRVRREHLERAVGDVTAALPVYRTYGARRPAAGDRRALVAALARARRAGAPPAALRLLERVLRLRFPVALSAADRRRWRAFVRRWQQFTGPVAAKGVEDTALYRDPTLVSLNEVGCEPHLPPNPAAHFHRLNARRARRWPRALSATATHDTKRGEDVRARLHVLSEWPEEWARRVRRWRGWNRPHRRGAGNGAAPDPADELLLYQTLVGAWPVERRQLPGFPGRVREYMVKAAREAKRRTSWLAPNPEYEDGLTAFVTALLQGKAQRFREDLERFQRRVAWFGALNSLSRVVLNVAAPGVPDFYQGTELWDLSLVDPDNRRPVEFDRRRQLLDDLIRCARRDRAALLGELLARWRDGRVKLFVTWQGLELRRRHAELLAGGRYIPLPRPESERPAVCAFARRRGQRWILAAVPRLLAGHVPAFQAPLGRGTWGRRRLPLPAGAPASWTDLFTGAARRARKGAGGGRHLELATLFDAFPVALLEAPAGRR